MGESRERTLFNNRHVSGEEGGGEKDEDEEGGNEERGAGMRRGRKWLKEAVPSTENSEMMSVVSRLVLFCPACCVSNVPCQLPAAGSRVNKANPHIPQCVWGHCRCSTHPQLFHLSAHCPLEFTPLFIRHDLRGQRSAV